MVSMTIVLFLLCVNGGTSYYYHHYLGRRPTFFASLSTSQTLSSINDIVKFEDVRVNIYSGYDSKTGIFTAPRSGVYLFYCTIMANGDSEVQFQLNKNYQYYTGGYAAKSNYGAQTVNSIMQLRTGDRVYIKHRTAKSQNVLGHGYSTFSGYLLSY
ncbi:C1QL [Mytilus coruscus]|uniref:C1QL n=1 Tax=Mytilus coruscus TaxID=42192 RepID=A0A6J8A1N4_MYTCO|nr:C1QL [Mytilus coruscus]